MGPQCVRRHHKVPAIPGLISAPLLSVLIIPSCPVLAQHWSGNDASFEVSESGEVPVVTLKAPILADSGLIMLCMARGSVEQPVAPHMSGGVHAQLLVNIVAGVTAAVGAVALQESPLTAVQMVSRTRLGSWPSIVLDSGQYTCGGGHASCFQQDSRIRKLNIHLLNWALLRHVKVDC